MKGLKAIALVFCAALILLASVPGARADEWNKMTVVTFNQPVEVPGAILPAGTYVFKLMDSAGDRNVVQILNKDQTHLYATVLAIPAYRDRPAQETVVRFAERPADSPEAIEYWYYPGDQYGVQFVYPKSRALELAKANRTNIPSTPTELAQTSSEPVQSSLLPSGTDNAEPVKGDDDSDYSSMEQTPVKETTPSGEDADVSQAQQPQGTESATPAQNPSGTDQNEKLPKTASPFPLIGLIGVLSLVSAAGLRLAARKAT